VSAAAGLAEKAEALRALHRPGAPLVLANVWDAGGARQVEAAGFPAVATSSAAVAESLGHADEQNAPVAEMLAAAARVARAVSVPVTADFEAGYGLAPEEVVERLLAAGVVGCNLEDSDHAAGGLVDAGRQAEWLHGVREAATAAGVPLVVNARVDEFLHARAEGRDEGTALAAAVARARAYVEAGADCVYPILVRDPAVRDRFLESVSPVPVNLISTPGGLTVAEAAKAGAARVSLGTSLWRAHQAWLSGRLTELA
jgi:2-methylisocitrate lyase-like PEP mutase family enzyme